MTAVVNRFRWYTHLVPDLVRSWGEDLFLRSGGFGPKPEVREKMQTSHKAD